MSNIDNGTKAFQQGVKLERSKKFALALESYKKAASYENERAIEKLRFYHLNIPYFLMLFMIVFLTIGLNIYLDSKWVSLIIGGTLVSVLTYRYYSKFWYKTGFVFILNFSLMVIGFILVPYGAINPYLSGISWLPIVILLVLAILVFGLGIVSYIFDKSIKNLVILCYGMLVVIISLVSFSIETPAKTFVTKDVEGGVEIIGFRIPSDIVEIPEKIGNKKVVSIGASAFYRENIKEVIVPETVKSIKQGAFMSTPLQSIELPDEVEIESYAFAYTNLTEISLPSTLVDIPDYLFIGSTQLETVDYSPDLLSVGDYAFSYTSIKQLELPLSLTNIGKGSFSYMYALKSIEIPENVQFLGEELFRGNVSLESVVLPDHIDTLPAYIFANNLALTEIDLPISIKQIDDYAFKNSAIENISGIENVEKFGKGVFENAKELKSIVLGNIKGVPDNMFYGAVNLENIEFTSDIQYIDDYAFSGAEKLKSITIPQSTTIIGNGAFENCESLTHITLPDNLDFLGESAFKNCIGLTNVILPNTLTIIENSLFDGAINLESVVLPNMLESIDTYAFRDTSITSISIPQTVTSIGEGAFYSNSKLSHVDISEGLLEIGSYAFFNSDLESIDLPQSLESIGDFAFSLNERLETIHINENVSYVGYGAFFKNSNLTIFIINNLYENNWDPNWNRSDLPVEYE